ncbi:MAG: LuxR C-terminal-related transcriptional regulator [Gaiellaceae bacterium]
MDLSRRQPRVGRERRIIERPRLIKLLDECEAPIILLLAPAGYGKTTLARQWARTLSGAIWVSLTPAHRDVVTFAADLVDGVETLGGRETSFIREYLRAQSNPQRAAHDVGVALATQMNDAGTQWVVLDDYHEVAEVDEPVALINAIVAGFHGRILITSRMRPTWVTPRRVIYGEIRELDRSQLAMTGLEQDELLGARSDLAAIRQQAEGWPAVLNLAAALAQANPPRGAMPDALYHYVAEELYTSAPGRLREDLVTLALLPRLEPELLSRKFGDRKDEVVREARDLGFMSGETQWELHPVLREFLLSKLSEERHAGERVRAAIDAAVAGRDWEHALSLLLRFPNGELVDPVLTQAFGPLVRAGKVGTLSAFAATVRLTPAFPDATIDLIDAEVALREGQLELAIDLGRRAHRRLATDHPLRSRTSAIIGHGHFLLASFDAAEGAFAAARSEAVEGLDAAEAVHGLALTKVFGERDGAESAVAALAELRHQSPVHLLRYATADLNRRRFTEGLRLPLGLDEALHTLPRVDDPRARTSFTHSASYALALRADYEDASRYLDIFLNDVRAFDLRFALPYANWTAAMIALGTRRFGDAERALQMVEDAGADPHQERHAANAKSLRARLLLQTGQPNEALQYVRNDMHVRLLPSWLGEYLATRALVLACLYRHDEAVEAAVHATAACRAVEVSVFAATARAVVAANAGEAAPITDLVTLARRSDIWDPVICALRASPPLAEALVADKTIRPTLEELYRRSGDSKLAKRAGFRTRATRSPGDVLSPREREVLGLIAGGLRNRQISEALFIADSTTKVHVRHILEKLGVRTRAEAVARYEMFATAKSDES